MSISTCIAHPYIKNSALLNHLFSESAMHYMFCVCAQARQNVITFRAE